MESMIDVDEFLEHHGVKGMKWGQRKALRRNANARVKEARSDLREAKAIRKEIRKDTSRRGRNLAIAGTVVAGAGAAAVIMSRSGSTKITAPSSSAMAFMATGKDWVLETNNAQAFETTLKILNERGG